MSKPNPADLPASMVILGLLIEKPDQPVSEIARTLDKRFTRSRFHPSTAHNALPQMAKAGRSRPRVRCTYRAVLGRDSKQDRYEATSEGVEAFRGWMTAVPDGAPALREALYGRIELCRLSDLPELIRLAREEALIARDLYSSASTTIKQHTEDEPDEAGTAKSEADYLRMVREVLLYVTPQYWASRHEHMEEIRRHLEGIARQAAIPFTVPR